MNAVLGSRDQNAWIVPAEAARLLEGTQRAALWSALSESEQEQAILDVTSDVQALTWRGNPFFADQPWALPTDQLCAFYYITAESNSTGNVVYLKSMAATLTGELEGGAVHLIDATTDAQYRHAATISTYDRIKGRLTLAEAFAESLAGKRLLLLAPLPVAVRRALALQAVDRGAIRRHHDLADAVHRGVYAMGDGMAAGDRGGRTVWCVDAYWLAAPFLARGLQIQRG